LVVDLVQTALGQEQFPPDALGALDPDAPRLARTASRRVLGFMNDMALTSRLPVDRAGGLEHADLDDLNRRRGASDPARGRERAIRAPSACEWPDHSSWATPS
jgi:hypothetical protein